MYDYVYMWISKNARYCTVYLVSNPYCLVPKYLLCSIQDKKEKLKWEGFKFSNMISKE